MKKWLLFFNFMFIGLSVSTLRAQNPEAARLVRMVEPVENEAGIVIFRKISYNIECHFSETLSRDSAELAENWKITFGDKIVPVTQILWKRTLANRVILMGEFNIHDAYVLQYMQGKPIQVQKDSSMSGISPWAFGRGKALDMAVRRLADKKALLALDYKFNVNILERYLTSLQGNFWFRDLSFNMLSEGTLAADESVRNGTRTALGLATAPYYFVGGLIYRAEISAAYQFETFADVGNRLFNIINKALTIGLDLELPYTNYPMYKLHSKTGYVRLAMPLTVKLGYLFEGENKEGIGTPSRLDIEARYELAFSPFLILKGTWAYSRFWNAPADFINDATFYSLTIAQDLDILKDKIELLNLLLGGQKEALGKHFIFYRISVGRRAPAFQDIREQSFGFGLYL
ncbi:MAG: hypothetical protein P8184_04730 [Calditrichia bacterium]